MMLPPEDEAKLTGRPVNEVRLAQHAQHATTAWLREQIQALGVEADRYSGPLLGSPEWLTLPADDPQRAAAILHAARAWVEEKADMPGRFMIEMEQADKFAEWVVAEANDTARSMIPDLLKGVDAAVRHQAERERGVRATPWFTPVAIPGQRGMWRHCIDGEQVDLPYYQLPRSESAA